MSRILAFSLASILGLGLACASAISAVLTPAPVSPAASRPLLVEIVETAEQKEQANRRESQSDRHERMDLVAQEKSANAADRQVTIGWWMLAVSVVSTFALFWTLRETRRQADATNASADGARRVAQATTDAFHTAERAWVGYAHIKHGKASQPDDRGQQVAGYVLQATFVNQGRTPAINASLYSELVVREAAGQPAPSFEVQAMQDPDPTALVPGTSVMSPPRFLTEMDAKAIFEGEKEAFLYAYVRYNDVFVATLRESEMLTRVDITGVRDGDKVNWEFSPVGARHNRAT